MEHKYKLKQITNDSQDTVEEKSPKKRITHETE